MWRARGRGPRSRRGWWDSSGSARYMSPRAQSWVSAPLDSHPGRSHQSPGRGNPYRYFLPKGDGTGDTSFQSDFPELSSGPTVSQSEMGQAETIGHSREIERQVIEPSREDGVGILGKRKLPPEYDETVDFSDEKQLKLDTEFTAQLQEREQKVQNEGEPSSEAAGESGSQAQAQTRDEKQKKPPPPEVQLSPEEIRAFNRKVLTIANLKEERFFCSICLAQLLGKRNVGRHVVSHEHIRRIVAIHNTEEKPYSCNICYCNCPSMEVLQQHLQGKKHVRNVQLSEQAKECNYRPMGRLLDSITQENVLQEGDGLSLGLSPSMLKFFSLAGPFIGLQYAMEVGTPDDVNPKYTCTLCNVIVDAGNHSLHFCSAAHRTNVLKKDYPEKYSEMARQGLKKHDLNEKLKEIAAEIESKEGRKVELIKRRIIQPAFKGISSKQQQQQPMKKRGRGQAYGSPRVAYFANSGQGSWREKPSAPVTTWRDHQPSSSGGFGSPQSSFYNQRRGMMQGRGRGESLRGGGRGERRGGRWGGRGGREFGRGSGDQARRWGGQSFVETFTQGAGDFSSDSSNYAEMRNWAQGPPGGGHGRGGAGPVARGSHSTSLFQTAAEERSLQGSFQELSPSERFFLPPQFPSPMQQLQQTLAAKRGLTPPHMQLQPQLQSPTSFGTSPQLQIPTSFGTSPQLQIPTSFGTSPQLQIPTSFGTSPQLQIPTSVGISPQLQIPTSFGISPQLQTPASVGIPPQLQAPTSLGYPPQLQAPGIPPQLQAPGIPPHGISNQPPGQWGKPAPSIAFGSPAGCGTSNATAATAVATPLQREPEQIGSVPVQQLQSVVRTLSDKGASKDTSVDVQQLAASLVQSEEDAEVALQLSSALTQALLAYRIKSVSKSIPENPLTQVLNTFQGSGGLSLDPPTSENQ